MMHSAKRWSSVHARYLRHLRYFQMNATEIHLTIMIRYISEIVQIKLLRAAIVMKLQETNLLLQFHKVL